MTKEDIMKNILLQIARDAIQSKFDGHHIDKESLIERYPELGQKGAVFVTLTEDDNLRGCIGSIVAHTTLLEDIMHNARSAAFDDPRFTSLSESEMDKIKLEVSLLTPPVKVDYVDTEDLKKKIIAKEDGVILKLNGYQATFLPQVWEELTGFELFFAHLCHKAGLGQNCLSEHPEIYTYHVDKVKEA